MSDTLAMRTIHAPRSLHDVRRFLVFAAEIEEGGWKDFVSGHDTLVAAEQVAHYLTDGPGAKLWAQVVDVLLLRLVAVYHRHVGRID